VLGAVAALGKVLITSDMATLAVDGQLEHRQGEKSLVGQSFFRGLTRCHIPFGTWCGCEVVSIKEATTEKGTCDMIERIAYLRRGGPPPGPAIITNRLGRNKINERTRQWSIIGDRAA
jgi:hypothetical protein